MENTKNTSEESKDQWITSKSERKTQIISLLDDETMEKAGEFIRNGRLVSFPTETVYGLGANALDAEACTWIFTTKERPMTDPLIVHVAEKADAHELINEDASIMNVFDELTELLWPGPLTCVMKANHDKISPVITANTGYVGIRCPNNEVAQRLIKAADRPIAAPSANKFGHVSPTKAEHVFNDFKDDGVLILDGGQCSFGIESTVLKIYTINSDNPTQTDEDRTMIKLLILRKGGVSEKTLQKFISDYNKAHEDVILCLEVVTKKHFTQESHPMEAPGQFLRHYAPNLPSYMMSSEKCDDSENKEIILSNCVLLDFEGRNSQLRDKVLLYLDLSERGDYSEAINRVYDYLRISETQEKGDMVLIANLLDDVSVEGNDEISNFEYYPALFDRLFRAVSGKGIKLDDSFTKYSITNI